MNAIALVGDYCDSVVAHRAIPRALEIASDVTGAGLRWEWIRTDEIGPDGRLPAGKPGPADLADFAAVWVVPGSPYARMEGTLAAIRFARETGRPFLGTCGGFQHALIEFARNVCGEPRADHAETAAVAPSAGAIRSPDGNLESYDPPSSSTLVVTLLECALVEKSGQITFSPGSRLHAIFNGQPTIEGYQCRFGLNPAWRDRLAAAGLRFTGFDAAQQVRAMELPSHPFFVGTLFQPERSALRNRSHPLVEAFVRAAVQKTGGDSAPASR
jgi:CTP synthase (UTP-ammonia lyase)